MFAVKLPQSTDNTSTGQPSFGTGALIVPCAAPVLQSDTDSFQAISETNCRGAGAGVGDFGPGLASGKQHFDRTDSSLPSVCVLR